MKIALIAPTYLPARRANTMQVMKMAQALTAIGHAVTVFVPGKAEPAPDWGALAHHYGLQSSRKDAFQVQWVPVSPRMRRYDYGVQAVRQARKWEADWVYTRLPQAAAAASWQGIPTIYEVHDLPQGKMGPILLQAALKGRGARGLVVITAALRDALLARYPFAANLPVVTAPDGVDLARYDDLAPRTMLRETIFPPLNIPLKGFVAGYTGHLYAGRGVDLIFEIASQLPDVHFLLAGGEPDEVLALQQQAAEKGLDQVTLTGFISNADLAQYQAACDLLLMPYQRSVAASSGGDIAKYLSPMKLFEYMASGRVILSSDLPVLQEVLTPQNAVLLPPDDCTAWVQAVKALRGNPKMGAERSARAQNDVRAYTWEARAQKILDAGTRHA